MSALSERALAKKLAKPDAKVPDVPQKAIKRLVPRPEPQKASLPTNDAKTAPQALPVPSNKAPVPQHGRLPDGSRFVMSYAAGSETWHGVLKIPGQQPLIAQAKAVFTLMRKLDAMCRRRLRGEVNCSD